jgi:serine protease Do
MNRHLIDLSIWFLGFGGFLMPFGACQSGSASENAGTIQNLSGSFADLALKVRPSVVQIRTIGFGSLEGGAAGVVVSQFGTGSGVILDSDGFIVTNAHVVKGARIIEVWLHENPLQASDPSETMQKKSAVAKLIGADWNNDLAVLKIDRTGLLPLNLADSDSLRQGQIVLAFGSPMALENSVTMGVISSVERQLSPYDPATYIQTDAPINPGNSGGPLVDARGRLVGINTFILSQSGGNEGIGFAIPANTVKRIYTELCKSGHIRHGHIGVRPLAVTPFLAAGLGLPRDWGVILEDVDPGGPSDQAGLKPGDLVLSVDGEAITRLHQLLMAVDQHAIGDVLKMVVLRGSDKIEAGVTVQVQPDDPNRFLEMADEESDLVSSLGILAIDIDETMLKMIPELRKPAGILVAALVAGSAGLEEGLEPGDLIIALNGNPVFNVEKLREFLGTVQAGNPIVLQIQREDKLKYVVMDFPWVH